MAGVAGRRAHLAACPIWERRRARAPHLDPILRTRLGRCQIRAPKTSPFCVVLLALIGRPQWFSDCVFFAVSRSTAASPVLSSSSSSSFCVCLDQENQTSRTTPRLLQPRPLICRVPDPNSLLPCCFLTFLPLVPRRPSRYPPRHSDPSRRVAARDSLETTTPPTDCCFQRSKYITTRWVNHGEHIFPPPLGTRLLRFPPPHPFRRGHGR